MKDGGQAFPVIENAKVNDETQEIALRGNPGMSLRDYFAAKAMQAIVSVALQATDTENIAGAAYEYADAMLLARGK